MAAVSSPGSACSPVSISAAVASVLPLPLRIVCESVYIAVLDYPSDRSACLSRSRRTISARTMSISPWRIRLRLGNLSLLLRQLLRELLELGVAVGLNVDQAVKRCVVQGTHTLTIAAA